jgi:hypothetical protein
MNKENIKLKLRETIDELFNIDEKVSKKKKKKKKTKARVGEKKEYADVQREFEKLGGPSMVDIMKLIGISDDEKGVNRSLFRKKVKQIKNKDTGAYYQFDDEELAKVRSALNIK